MHYFILYIYFSYRPWRPIFHVVWVQNLLLEVIFYYMISYLVGLGPPNSCYRPPTPTPCRRVGMRVHLGSGKGLDEIRVMLTYALTIPSMPGVAPPHQGHWLPLMRGPHAMRGLILVSSGVCHFATPEVRQNPRFPPPFLNTLSLLPTGFDNGV